MQAAPTRIGRPFSSFLLRHQSNVLSAEPPTLWWSVIPLVGVGSAKYSDAGSPDVDRVRGYGADSER